MTSEQIKVSSRDLGQHQLMFSHFRRIFESIPDAVVCTDQRRRIVMVNPATERIFGFQEEELLDRGTDCLYNSREDFLRQSSERLDGDPAQFHKPFETTMKRKDGTTFPAETVCTVVGDGEDDFISYLKLIRDISERKELENNIRHLELTFRTVADFTYDWECWIQPDGNFRYVSPSCLRLTGHPVEDFMADASLFRKIIHPDDRPVWDKHHHESTANAGLREVQFRIIRDDGVVRWIEHACQPVRGDHGELLGFRSSNRDITTRKDYEQELHQALVEIKNYQEQLEAESAYLRDEIRVRLNYDNIIGCSNAMQYVFFKIEQIRDSDATVLLLGETGTGKELIARAIHNSSPRKDRSLVKVNCATLSANLIESELFGHEKGAFTSADRKHIGRFEFADKGTMFLDEIGELPLELQAKLLRVLQEGEFERVGSSRTITVDVRVIAATNRNLEKDVQQGLFRKDLWYRLNVFPITAPPLRDRVEDIPQLVRYFMEIFGRRQRKNITNIPAGVMTRLVKYPWPGNVRELENVIERAVLNTARETLVLADELQHPSENQETTLPTLMEMERNYLIEVLEKTNWKVSGKNSAAEILGLQRSTLRAKIKKHKIRKP